MTSAKCFWPIRQVAAATTLEQRRFSSACSVWCHIIATERGSWCNRYPGPRLEWNLLPTHWWANEFCSLSRECWFLLLFSAPMVPLVTYWILASTAPSQGQSKPIGMLSPRPITPYMMWNYILLSWSWFAKMGFNLTRLEKSHPVSLIFGWQSERGSGELRQIDLETTELKMITQSFLRILWPEVGIFS